LSLFEVEGVDKQWVDGYGHGEVPNVNCSYPFCFGFIVWGFFMSLEGVAKGETILVSGKGV
jgi:hypothetical protein